MSAQQRIEKYLALAEQATKGPWVAHGLWMGQCHIKHAHGGPSCKYDYTLSVDPKTWGGYIAGPEHIEIAGADDYGAVLSKPNASFIASSRTEGPAYAKALRAVLAVPERHHIYSDEGEDSYVGDEFDSENDAHDHGWNEALKAVRAAIEQALSEG